MSEEIKEAIKLFGREDLLNDYGIQDIDTNIEVFMSVKDMIKYYKQGKEIDKLVDTMEDLNKEFSHYKYESKKENRQLHAIIKEVREVIEDYEKENIGEWIPCIIDTVKDILKDGDSNENK